MLQKALQGGLHLLSICKCVVLPVMWIRQTPALICIAIQLLTRPWETLNAFLSVASDGWHIVYYCNFYSSLTAISRPPALAMYDIIRMMTGLYMAVGVYTMMQ
jgi:hypothetical protein